MEQRDLLREVRRITKTLIINVCQQHSGNIFSFKPLTF